MSQPTPTWPTTQDLADLQGDVVLGIPKRAQDFVFFTIQDSTSFKKNLKQLTPAITSTAKVQEIRKAIDDHKKQNRGGLVKVVGVNIAFSALGLTQLGVSNDIGDTPYKGGMKADVDTLGDEGTPDDPTNWLPEFKGDVHGIVLIGGDCRASVDEGRNKVLNTLANSIKVVLKVEADVRPGSEKGHEHFGFLDGISSPAIEALTGHKPGQIVVDPGVLVCGQFGDVAAGEADHSNLIVRPDWTKNGSFLVYRHLKQLVPEFNKYLDDNALNFPEIPREQGSALLGARLVGRWKSGAPIDITPLQDDPDLANDDQRNNNFDFSAPPGLNDQTRCPFAAHVRKTNPRQDLLSLGNPDFLHQRMINRQGIPFGGEVTQEEAQSNTTKVERGLSFVCYQANIENGFQFVQHSWANTENFMFNKTFNGQPIQPGFDPIIGQNHGGERSMIGSNSSDPTTPLKMPFDFVVSQGGQYFFAPSISALKTEFTT